MSRPSCCSSERLVVTVGQSEADGCDGSEVDDGSVVIVRLMVVMVVRMMMEVRCIIVAKG